MLMGHWHWMISPRGHNHVHGSGKAWEEARNLWIVPFHIFSRLGYAIAFSIWLFGVG